METQNTAYHGSNPPSGGFKSGHMLPLASSIKHIWQKQVHDEKKKFCLDKGDTLYLNKCIQALFRSSA